MNKKRYKEEYVEGSDLLWPSDKEDKITRQFYKNLSQLSNSKNPNDQTKRLSLIKLIFSLFKLQS